MKKKDFKHKCPLRVFGKNTPIIPVDYHVHSNFSDGENTVEECIISARKKGLTEIALTDHVRKDSDWIDDYVSQIRSLARALKFKAIVGLEAKVVDFKGNVNISKGSKQKVDFVMGVVHRFLPDMDQPYNDILNLSADKASQLETELILKMITNPDVDVIGHPTRVYNKFFYLTGKTKKKFPGSLINKICTASLAFNKPLEYNPNFPLNDKLLDAYLKLGVSFFLGTDSHNVNDLGSIDYKKLSESLKRARQT